MLLDVVQREGDVSGQLQKQTRFIVVEGPGLARKQSKHGHRLAVENQRKTCEGSVAPRSQIVAHCPEQCFRSNVVADHGQPGPRRT